MRTAFSDTLIRLAKADSRVLLLTGDHGYALFDAFRRECPQQYLNCGIAEQNMIGVAAGLAKTGFRPIVYGLAAFIPIRVLEQIKMDVCYENLPVIFIGDGAGFVYSHLGTSHQSTEDIACMRAIPEAVVLSPADRFEMKWALECAYNVQRPVYIRVGKSDKGSVHATGISCELGGLIKLRSGTGGRAIIATGSMVSTAMALDLHDAEVWSAPSIKPLNADTVLRICRDNADVITMEEHSIIGGLGAAVAELTSGNPAAKIARIGVRDRFSLKCGSYEYLLREHGLDGSAIAAVLRTKPQ